MKISREVLKRYLLISFGFLSLGIAVVGLFLPLMPTTPFLLLSAACFYRSSERFHSWLLNQRFFGRHIRNYQENRAIEPRTKWLTLITLWSTFGFSICLFWHTVYIPIILVVVALIVSWHILRLKTIRE